ncbi:hypothetical protein L1987_86738 [Smallanthus sonchifolius]|uniref:Uncharacterized protein n=1 Tax=Smallanthus sonchifolius TaxID=185202 RepID=A0ACB8Y0Z3_9ASTR|nr:hypothetical protein L1987_86738 [Smallanthus sonchifolius]
MDELKTAMNDHLDQMQEIVEKFSSELRIGMQPAMDNFIGFFHAIDWKSLAVLYLFLVVAEYICNQADHLINILIEFLKVNCERWRLQLVRSTLILTFLILKPQESASQDVFFVLNLWLVKIEKNGSSVMFGLNIIQMASRFTN